jgi:hypothetical protein
MAQAPGGSAARLGAGCAAQLLLFAGVSAAGYLLMTPGVRNADVRLGFALVSGLFLTVGLSSFWSLLRGHGRGEGSRATLLRRARTGEPAPDGGPVIATGAVRSLSLPLNAPLSGIPCVAYSYRMFRETRSTEGDRRQEPVYWGYASKPFALDGAVARTRVLAVPQFAAPAERHSGGPALERARRWIRNTPFEEVRGDMLGVVGTAFSMAHEIFTDEDGEARRDWNRHGDERDPADLLLEESVLPVGAAASVHGTWSAERGAIVAGGDPAIGAGVSVVLGPPEELGGALPHSTGAYLATAAISTLLGGGIVWFALAVLPGMM